jgi:glycosyltransferase involved in cell wall biosynthesis
MYSETFLAEVVRGLDRLGWEAWVASEREPVNREAFPFPPDGRLLRPQPPSRARRALGRAVRRSPRERGAAWWRPLVDRVRPALQHVHFGWLAATVAFERLGAPLIVAFHGSDVRSWPHRSTENRRAFDALLRSLDVATSSSRSIAAALRSLGYGGRIEVIPPGVPLDRFAFREPERDAAPPRLLFVGRQVQCKGLDVLLRALPSVLGRHPGATLTVIGEGPEAPRHAQLVRTLRLGESVRFLGACAHADVAVELRRAHALVVPSRTEASGAAEGSPVAPKEALATGVPVVATTCGGLPEVIPPAQRGSLVPENDAPALAGAIAALLDRPDTWGALAVEGRRWVEEQFDSARLARRLADLYAEVSGERPA